jgi:hypothetical protein
VSDLRAEGLTYQAVVAEYFLALRGAGLVLSPLDLDEVDRWERRGLPVSVVCRGLRHGVERAREELAAGGALPRSLRTFRHAVEEEWQGYKSAAVGQSAPPPEERQVVRQRLESVRSLVQRALVRHQYGQVWGAAHGAALEAVAVLMANPPSLDGLDRALARIETGLCRVWIRSLDAETRRDLGGRCRRLAGRRQPAMRPRAYREMLRAHLLDEAARAGLLRLVGTV